MSEFFIHGTWQNEAFRMVYHYHIFIVNTYNEAWYLKYTLQAFKLSTLQLMERLYNIDAGR